MLCSKRFSTLASSWWFIFLLLLSTANGLGELDVDTSIEPLDVTFEEFSCIVRANYAEVDCDLLPPDRLLPEDAPPNPCPGCDDPDGVYNVDTGVSVGRNQIEYEQLEDALDFCPFDPVLIEIVGTHYISNDPYLWYNQTKDLLLVGHDLVQTTGGLNVTTLEEQLVTYYNDTLMMNITELQLVEVVTQSPVTVTRLRSTIVGFKDMQIQAPNISITVENITFEGCGTDRPLFLSFIKPERCGYPEGGDCAGAWFHPDDAERILTTGICQRTGAHFDGYRAIQQVDENSEAWYFESVLTVEFWFQPTTTDLHRRSGLIGPIHSDDDDGQAGYGFEWADYDVPCEETGEPGWGVTWNVAGKRSGFSITHERNYDSLLKTCTPLNQWTHLAGTFNNGFYVLYANGVEVGNRTKTRPEDSTIYYEVTKKPFAIGMGSHRSNYKFYTGNMDDVRVWNVARSPSQIQSAYQQTVDPNNPTLKGYWRFDLPLGSETYQYEDNLVVAAQGLTQFETHVIYRRPNHNDGAWVTADDFGDDDDSIPTNGFGPPDAIPDCMCEFEEGLCVPDTLLQENPPSAIDEDNGEYCDFSDLGEGCTFVHGMLIDPNGEFGELWLPGLVELVGPDFAPVEHFVPGKFYERPETELVPVITVVNGTNVTTYVEQPTGGTELYFVPGAVPSQLPPLGLAVNPWFILPIFMPGWFANDGLPPFSNLNFFPGIFVEESEANGMYGVPTPAHHEEGDLVFVPGIEFIPGFFAPFPVTSPNYIIPIVDLGGFVFNEDKHVSPCFIPDPPLPTGPIEYPSVLELQNEFGCTAGPDDPEPEYLDPSERDPCFVLRDLRASMVEGTESLPLVEVLGCHIGENDPEPVYLDPSARDPCFVLREIQQQLGVSDLALNCSRDGGVLLPEVFWPCLINQNFTMSDSDVRDYYGDRVLCQHSCDENSFLVLERNTFVRTPGSAVYSTGLENYDVHDNSFCPCGGTTEACVYLNGNHVSEGEYAFYNNRHCAVNDTLPYLCDYDISPELRCLNGKMQCLNVVETLLLDCQRYEIADGILAFDTDCAVFAPCNCTSTAQNVTLPNGEMFVQELFGGPLVIELPFITPILAGLLGDNETLTLECNTQLEDFAYTYDCELYRIIELPNPIMPNESIFVNQSYIGNCTEVVTFAVGSPDGLDCPCPIDWVTNSSISGVGSSAVGGTGVYDTCQWPLPADQGYLPTEQCVDTVVWCTYEGGQLGDADPPPVALSECYMGEAWVPCTADTCVGGLLYYEGVYHVCDLSSGSCASDQLLQVSCECEDGALTVVCDRSSCVPPMPCSPGEPLCEYLDGELDFDGEVYQCVLLENETLCEPGTYAPAAPVPPQGYLTLPCSNGYEVPPPGPCSCIPNTVVGGGGGAQNFTLPPCDPMMDPNCTADAGAVDTGNELLQLTCGTNGQYSCRCDGFYAQQFDPPGNGTRFNESVAYYLDNVNDDVELFYMQQNTAVGLYAGVRLERITWDLITRTSLKIPHFRTNEGGIHELSRANPLITGTVYDWVDGRDDQWNRRVCSNGCHQPRPRELVEACVVDSRYGPQTELYQDLRFSRIQDAIDNCEFDAVVVKKASNLYEERLWLDRENFWLGTYDGAVIVASGHSIRSDNITLRGFRMVHPNTNTFPLLVAGGVDEFFDTNIDDDIQGRTVADFSVLNCIFQGDGVNDAGAVIGEFKDSFTFSYNTIEGFLTRAVDIKSEDITVYHNVFRRNSGRAFRGRELLRYTFEENWFVDCSGFTAAQDVDMVALEAQADLGTIDASSLSMSLYQLLFNTNNYVSAFDGVLVDPDMGCNEAFDPARKCSFRGQVQHNNEEAVDQNVVCYHLRGGNITLGNIEGNDADHCKYGLLFSFVPSVGLEQASQIFKQNAQVRIKDTRQILDDSQDLAFKKPGSLVLEGCSFPDCLAVDDFYPQMEVNPRCTQERVDGFAFSCVNNITQCTRYGLPLNKCLVTSGVARLRREHKIFFNTDAYVEGVEDLPCCAKPVIYGRQHVFGGLRQIVEFLEMRYWFPAGETDDDAKRLFSTLEEFNALNIQFHDVCMDGRYLLPEERFRVIDVYLREHDGVFWMQNCRLYNWWHFPEGTTRGYLIGKEGNQPVIVMPDQTVYYEERAPDIEGVFAHFTRERSNSLRAFAVGGQTVQKQEELKQLYLSTRYPDLPLLSQRAQEDPNLQDRDRLAFPEEPAYGTPPESIARVVDCHFENFDGVTLQLNKPGSWDVRDSYFLNCGMREPSDVTVVHLIGNMLSNGDYWVENVRVNQSKPFLYASAHDQGNKIRKSAFTLESLNRPRVFVWRNTSVVRVEGDPNYVFKSPVPEGFFAEQERDPVALTGEQAPAETGDLPVEPNSFTSVQGLSGREGVNPFGWNDIKLDDIKPYTRTSVDLLGTPLFPTPGYGGTDGFYDPVANVNDANGIQVPFGTVMVQAIEANSDGVQVADGSALGIFQLNPTERGTTIALRIIDVDGDVLVMTELPETGGTYRAYSPFAQPRLHPLRVLAADQNSIQAHELLASGAYTYTTLPTNGPGLQGINSDVVWCSSWADAGGDYLDECTVCNDGCPVIPPDSCQVDPENGTFVPENPYYGTWLFSRLDDAILHCKDNRTQRIEVRRQSTPYRLPVNIQVGNWTIFSVDRAQFAVQQLPVQINAHNVTFEGIEFLHELTGPSATMVSGSALGAPPRMFTLRNCTFTGGGSMHQALLGTFESISLEQCLFEGYEGARVLELYSYCGALYMDGSRVNNANGAALFASEFEVVVMRDNVFDRCGGRVVDEMACVYLRNCMPDQLQLIFSGNEHYQESAQVLYERTGPDNGFVAAYWLDGIQYANGVAQVDLSGNSADGLPIGLRATRVESNAADSFVPGVVGAEITAVINKAAVVQELYLSNRNQAVDGTWHDAVVGLPADDQFIVDDPSGTSHLYCDENCVGAAQNFSLVVTLTIIGMLVCFYAWYTWYYRIPQPNINGYRWSEALQENVPINRNRWGEFGRELRERRDREAAAAEEQREAEDGEDDNDL